MTKKQKTSMIDEEILEKIKEDAEEEKRSESFIINEILKKHYREINGGNKNE